MLDGVEANVIAIVEILISASGIRVAHTAFAGRAAEQACQKSREFAMCGSAGQSTVRLHLFLDLVEDLWGYDGVMQSVIKLVFIPDFAHISGVF